MTSTVPPYPISAGIGTPSWAMSVPRYALQPCATTLAPRNISRMRSQPMIQANSSPSDEYENVYADPETGTVEANSA